MSALESPPSLTPAWQDPWGMVSQVNPADFYDQSKANMTQAFYPHQPMVTHGYPHHPMMDGQNNNNNSMNSGSEGSTGSSVTSTTVKKPQRQVNFKLDIKAEPQENQIQSQVTSSHPQGGMQKVPSISDLSEADSSLDIPCSQVPPLTPSSTKKVGEALKTTYATWEKFSERSAVPKDPRSWTKAHVKHWLSWAFREFSFEANVSQFVQQFQVRFAFFDFPVHDH